MAEVIDPKPAPERQLAAYEVGARVYDQIIAIHSNIATVANLYLLVTGGCGVPWRPTVSVFRLWFPPRCSSFI